MKRTCYDIYADMLEAALTPKRRSDLFYMARLSGGQYSKDIALLVKRGLLEELPGSNRTKVELKYKRVHTTEKGKKYLEAFKQIRTLLIVEEE